MAGFELEQLLAPVSEEFPAGKNLEYDPRFAELERACTAEAPRYAGKEEIPGKDPDWKVAQQIALELLSRTKDLRIAVHLASAATALDGIRGMAAGIALIRGLVERYWDTVHPVLDPAEGNDTTFRSNALDPLGSAGGLVGIVRRTYLVESRSVGKFTFRDLDIAEQRITPPAGESHPSAELLFSALTEAGAGYAQERKALFEQARADLQATDAAFTAGTGPNFEALDKTLGYAIEFLAKGLPKEQAAGLEESAPVPAPAAEGVAVGGLKSRADVKRVLEQVCVFIEKTEPSNPAPILIRRAQRLLDVSFMEIVKDLAPDAVAQIEKLAGIQPG